MRQVVCLSLIALLSLCRASAQATEDLSSFSGQWLRDDVIEANGRHLPRVIWQISFQKKTMTHVERVDEKQSVRTVVFNLNGKSSYTQPSWNKLMKQTHDEIGFTREFPEFKVAETWTLTNDGKTLNMIRKVVFADKQIQSLRPADTIYTFQKIQ